MTNTQRLVSECKRVLNKPNEKKNKQSKPKLDPSNSFQLGYETADKLAKRGANNINNTPVLIKPS